MNERITYDGICKYCGATKQTKIHYTNATTIFCKQCDIEYRTKGEKQVGRNINTGDIKR